MSSSSLRVAVTGGSGRIGSAVVKCLLARGHQVVNLDHRQAREPLARFVYVDLRRRELVQPVLEQVDAVCHLGEIPNYMSAAMGPNDIFAHNTACGSTVLQSAADLKLRHVVYTSSCQVYGCWGRNSSATEPLELPMNESEPVKPQNVYALSKVCNEQYARLMANSLGLSVSVFRLPMTSGNLTDPSWMAELRLPGYSIDGLGTYLHVVDAAEAYALAIENPQPGIEIYHLVADDVLSLKPIGPALAADHPTYPKLPSDWPAFKSPVNCDKARKLLGWSPKWRFQDHNEKSVSGE